MSTDTTTNGHRITRAVELLLEALKSDHLTPYVESRIRAALLALGESV